MNVTIGGIARTVEITSFDKLGDVKVCMLTTTADGSVGFQQLNQEVVDTIYASFPVDTANGDIASFEDGAENVPVRKLTLNLVPYQGGSGDPSPNNVRPIYPNNGKNLLPTNATDGTYTSSGITVTAKNGVYTVSGSATAGNAISFPLSTSVDLSPSTNKIAFLNDTAKSSLSVSFRRNGTTIHYWGMNTVNRVASGWTDSGNEVIDTIAIEWNSSLSITGSITISPMLMPLSIDSYTYVPYNAIGITRTGKNLFDNAITNIVEGQNIALVSGDDVKNTSNSAWASVRYELELPKGSYTVSIGTITQSANNAIIQVAKYNGSYSELCVLSASNTSRTFTLNNASTIRVSLYSSIANNSFTVSNLQIENGTSATSYEPYTAERYYPISANPVYGGTLEVETGVLTVDRVTETFTKDSAWYSFSTGTGNSSAVVQLQYYQNCKYVDSVSERNGAISSSGKEAQNYWTGPRQNEVPSDGDMCFAYSATGQLRFHRTDISSITDLASFKTNFPNTQIVYYLATPITYQLTPVQVKTLLGYNNIWTDSGTVEVQYRANIGLYIQKIIGVTEDDMVANQNIAANQYFFVGETLYLSTSAISAGQTIIVGTNCIKTNLADALNALNS